MKNIIKTLFLSFLFFTQVVSTLYASQEFLYRGNDHYDQGKYDESIKSYQEYLKGNEGSGEIYFNLGNAYFKNSQLGQSIFYYRLAEEIIPRDADLKFNLNYARKKRLDKLENSASWIEQYLTLEKYLNGKESVLILSFISLVFWGLSLLLKFKVNEWIRFFHRVFLIMFLLVGIVATKDYFKKGDFGVITSNDTKVFSAIGKNNIVLFTLNEGAEFKVSQKLLESLMK
jgi:tetratricopeptide (TPR) repeat protein